MQWNPFYTFSCYFCDLTFLIGTSYMFICFYIWYYIDYYHNLNQYNLFFSSVKYSFKASKSFTENLSHFFVLSSKYNTFDLIKGEGYFHYNDFNSKLVLENKKKVFDFSFKISNTTWYAIVNLIELLLKKL